MVEVNVSLAWIFGSVVAIFAGFIGLIIILSEPQLSGPLPDPCSMPFLAKPGVPCTSPHELLLKDDMAFCACDPDKERPGSTPSVLPLPAPSKEWINQ